MFYILFSHELFHNNIFKPLNLCPDDAFFRSINRMRFKSMGQIRPVTHDAAAQLRQKRTRR